MALIWRSIVLAIITLVCCSPALADANVEQQEIARLYKRALAGDKPAVEQCIAKLEAALKREPQNQLARVYLGSTYTLRSRDLGFGPNKLKVLKQGLVVMDEAVSANPQDGHVRLVRALTTDSLPFFLGRRNATRQDFETLVATARKTPGQFTEGDLQVIYFNAGNVARSDGDAPRALDLWREAARHPTDHELAEKVNVSVARGQ